MDEKYQCYLTISGRKNSWNLERTKLETGVTWRVTHSWLAEITRHCGEKRFDWSKSDNIAIEKVTFLANYRKTIANEVQSFLREMPVEDIHIRKEFQRSDWNKTNWMWLMNLWWVCCINFDKVILTIVAAMFAGDHVYFFARDLLICLIISIESVYSVDFNSSLPLSQYFPQLDTPAHKSIGEKFSRRYS